MISDEDRGPIWASALAFAACILGVLIVAAIVR